jgi:hypothetical protein
MESLKLGGRSSYWMSNLVEERVGQDLRGDGFKTERGYTVEVHHDSHKLEEFGHVEVWT